MITSALELRVDYPESRGIWVDSIAASRRVRRYFNYSVVGLLTTASRSHRAPETNVHYLESLISDVASCFTTQMADLYKRSLSHPREPAVMDSQSHHSDGLRRSRVYFLSSITSALGGSNEGETFRYCGRVYCNS